MTPILTRRTMWKREKSPRAKAKADLSPAEQAKTRRALEVLRIRLGTWLKVGEVLQLQRRTFARARRAPNLQVGFRVARYVGVPLEDLLAGRWPQVGECPLCGHVRLALPPTVTKT